MYSAEHYSRGHQLFSHLRASMQFTEPKISVTRSQELTTCPYMCIIVDINLFVYHLT
jgi:hypothetical protein